MEALKSSLGAVAVDAISERPRISVVIPALDEQGRIGRCVAAVRQAGIDEVIVVDGGSADETVREAAAAGARVVRSPAGRGVQQNRGAAQASGEILLFLHADTVLPADFPRHVETALREPGVVAGAFRFKLDEDAWDLRWVEWMVERRCRLFQLPYGDQAIFLRREAFDAVGGFPDTPVMEDYELVVRLKKQGRIAIADAAAVTSCRRWKKLGLLRTTLSNQLCVLAYLLNVNPGRIARWRRAGRLDSK